MASSNPALVLTLRFPSHLSDIHLPAISHPELVSGLSLLPQIRSLLPAQYDAARILLISAGRIVPLRESLAASLRLPRTSLPPQKALRGDAASEHVGERNSNGKGKGRAREEDENNEPDAMHIIIHATFSALESPLSDTELSAEEREGEALNAALQQRITSSTGDTSPTSKITPRAQQQEQRQHPRGFSRLLSAGIPSSDIDDLRVQFRSLLAANAPDAAPLTPLEVLALEERWLEQTGYPIPHPGSGPATLIDTNGWTNTGTGPSNGTGFDGFDTGDGFGSASQAIDDVLIGNFLGFFWPLGSLFWLARREGIWREARTSAVFLGVLVNVAFCLLARGLRGAGAAAENAG